MSGEGGGGGERAAVAAVCGVSASVTVVIMRARCGRGPSWRAHAASVTLQCDQTPGGWVLARCERTLSADRSFGVQAKFNATY